MRLYEYESKRLLKSFGLPVPAGRLLLPDDPLPSDPDLPFPSVIKSQVLATGRMKAGGIEFAGGMPELEASVDRLRKHPVHGLLPVALLVEPRAQILHEYYCAVTYDPRERGPVLVVSAAGGTGVEERVATGARVGRVKLPMLEPVTGALVRDALIDAGVPSTDLVSMSRVVLGLVQAFFDADLLLAELNPLAQTKDGRFMVLDAHVEMDDDALRRQSARLRALGIPEEPRQGKPPTSFEAAAQAIDQSNHRGVAGRVVEFSGPLGLIIGGGGASLSAFDAVRRWGGQPANYCEIGGNPSVSKVAALTELILRRPGVDRVAVIMNVVNNTRSDMVARGVIKGCLAVGRNPAETIVVFRIPGAGEEEANKLLRHWGIEPLGREVSIDQAARLAVERMSVLAIGQEGKSHGVR